MKRTRVGFSEANSLGNYNTFFWLFLTNDNDWLDTGNLGDQTNDFYSIAHHEIGHALIFNQAHPGFRCFTASANGAFTQRAPSPTITAAPPPSIKPQSNDHPRPGVIADPESVAGAALWL